MPVVTEDGLVHRIECAEAGTYTGITWCGLVYTKDEAAWSCHPVRDRVQLVRRVRDIPTCLRCIAIVRPNNKPTPKKNIRG